MLRRVIYTTNSIESLNYQLRKVSKNRGQHPLRRGGGEAVVAGRSATPVDKRAREREKEKNLPASKRKAKARMVEGQVTTNWKQALAQLAAAYPEADPPLPVNNNPLTQKP